MNRYNDLTEYTWKEYKRVPIRKIEDWPKPPPCRNPDHNIPSMISLPPGTYVHTCPGCGQEKTFFVIGAML